MPPLVCGAGPKPPFSRTLISTSTSLPASHGRSCASADTGASAADPANSAVIKSVWKAWFRLSRVSVMLSIPSKVPNEYFPPLRARLPWPQHNQAPRFRQQAKSFHRIIQRQPSGEIKRRVWRECGRGRVLLAGLTDHIAKRLMQFGRCGNDRAGFQHFVPARQIADQTAGLPHQDNAGRHIPRT